MGSPDLQAIGRKTSDKGIDVGLAPLGDDAATAFHGLGDAFAVELSIQGPFGNGRR